MSFLNPITAIIAAAVAVPALLILYFLKLRRRDVEVSTTLLWKRAIEDLQANAPFQRLRNNILLILQMLALLALLLAVAQPQLSANVSSGAKSVIIIDRSASMQATDGDPDKPGTLTRLEAAKRRALELVDRLREPGLLGGAGDEAMVIAMDTIGEVRQNFTTSKAALRAAIEAITPTDAPSRLKDTYGLARAFAQRPVFQEGAAPDQDGSRIAGQTAVMHLFSDGRLADAEKVEAQPEDVFVYHAVGSPLTENVGIVGLRAERSYDKPGTMSVFVALQSTAAAARAVDVQLAIDGQVAAIKQVTLPAAGAGQRTADMDPNDRAVVPANGGLVFSVDRPQAAIVSVSIRQQEPDAMPADDVGYLVVPPARRLAVALVTPGNLFLREVVEGLNLSRPPLVLTPGQAQAILDDPKKAGEYDVWILDRWIPTVRGADGKPAPGLPPGRFMVFGPPPPPPAGLIDRGPGEATIALDVRRAHPVMRPLTLDALVVTGARRTAVEDKSPVTVLAEGATGPLIVEAATLETRALIVAFDVIESTWWVDPSFVLFVAGGVRHLAGEGAESGEGVIQAGSVLTQRLPTGAEQVSISRPDRAAADLVPSADGQVVFRETQNVGIYTLSWKGPPGGSDVLVDGRVRRAVAANLLDPAESDLGTRLKLGLQSKLVDAQSGDAAGVRRLWPWLLLACLLIVMVEWWIYNRKVAI